MAWPACSQGRRNQARPRATGSDQGPCSLSRHNVKVSEYSPSEAKGQSEDPRRGELAGLVEKQLRFFSSWQLVLGTWLCPKSNIGRGSMQQKKRGGGIFQALSHLGTLGYNYSVPGLLMTRQTPPRNKYPVFASSSFLKAK